MDMVRSTTVTVTRRRTFDDMVFYSVSFDDGEHATVFEEGGRLPSKKTASQYVYVDSKSEPFTSYQVTIRGGRVQRCQCKGFDYRGDCRHLAVAQVALASVQEWHAAQGRQPVQLSLFERKKALDGVRGAKSRA